MALKPSPSAPTADAGSSQKGRAPNDAELEHPAPMKYLQLLAASLTVVVSAHAEGTRPECAAFATDLAAMVRADQALRSRWEMGAQAYGAEPPRIVQQTQVIDRQNTENLKRLIKVCGWPKRSVHGAGAVNDAWLLAQHADHDRKFQRSVLVHLQSAVAAGEAPGGQLAYLADRVAVGDGKPQLYGTQLDSKGPCQMDFLPLDDRAKVEERRRAVGLPPLEEYKRLVQENVLPPSCSAK